MEYRYVDGGEGEAVSTASLLCSRNTYTEQPLRHDFLASEFANSYRWLKQYLRRQVKCLADAEDVASAAFVEMASIPDVSVIREPRALLRTISQRLVFDLWRRRDLEAAYLAALATHEEADMPSPEAILEVVQTLASIDRLLCGLSSNARRAFLHSQLDGLTYREIADLLGVSVSMVRKYIAQALAKCYEGT
ncbi:sigma-70 family RNA polymerase sigma factor [Herbaspirillum rubrisubalbicans]|jgi:RNA polymerase sigma-70 factor (ECF subfamily)|uniref:sigma-70 family RNA polymerase sigma factor n=1 Tax=Herbaspirillum rubrisubalbicans TaxID=80842 RepID=UPI001ED98EB8|nr:sigma-70 family RNA polymerase sigma factor [Herbaspirillum rubrisubalbicans]MCP1574843.1 RNA polymerase sigma-70 factor (ECF subfamily) [Herbaspirillum rubrisubalbicans]